MPGTSSMVVGCPASVSRERSRVPDRDEQSPEDVMAAIRIVGRLLPLSEVKLNLRGADLRTTDLSDLSEEQVATKGTNPE